MKVKKLVCRHENKGSRLITQTNRTHVLDHDWIFSFSFNTIYELHDKGNMNYTSFVFIINKSIDVFGENIPDSGKE